MNPYRRIKDIVKLRGGPLGDVERVIVQLRDGSWMEFDRAQVIKITMADRPMYYIKGDPVRVIDFSALDVMFPPRCKYLDQRWYEK